MFSREDLECLDPGYFEIIYMDDRDVTIMSRKLQKEAVGKCLELPLYEK